MVLKCCVPACRSNYSYLKDRKYVSIFKFPKDEKLRMLWIQAIPRANFNPSRYSSVCINHFEENDVIKEEKYLKPDGTIQMLLLRNPSLKKDAVPKIFPNLPKELPKSTPKARTDPHLRNKARTDPQLSKKERTNPQLSKKARTDPKLSKKERTDLQLSKKGRTDPQLSKKARTNHQLSKKARNDPQLCEKAKNDIHLSKKAWNDLGISFFNQLGLSKKARTDPQLRKMGIISGQENETETFKSSDVIVDFDDLINNYSVKTDFSGWEIKKVDNEIYFYVLNLEKSLTIDVSIQIDRNLQSKLYIKNVRISPNDLKWILPFDLTISRWSQLTNLLARYKNASR